jgi:sugar lactone lactonase YvrE
MNVPELICTPRYEVLASGLEFVEAPRVDESGAVWFSDFTAGGLFCVGVDGEVRRFLPDRKWIGGIVHNADGTVLCSGRGGIVRLDPRTGESQPVLEELGGTAIEAVNDIEADASGAIFGGTIDFTSILERRAPRPGVFFRITPDRAVRVIRDEVVASNGIAFSPDGSRLYHAESMRGVWVYEVDGPGIPRNPVLFADLADCDGVATDCEGALWVARWKTGEIVRYLDDGTVERRLRVPYPYVVSLAFGGADLCDLIATTGGAPGRALQGAVLRIRSEVPGVAAHQARLP